MDLLIVDDEAHIRTLVRALLPQGMQLRVVGEAANGLEALEKCRRFKPHVVMTDIRMPELDGLGLAEAISNEFPLMQVIVVSGYDDFAYACSAMRWGVIGYLLKPIDENQLRDCLVKAARMLKQYDDGRSQLASAKHELHKMQDFLMTGATRSDGHAVSAVDSPVIQKVLEMIQEEYNQSISLDDIAGRLYMNSAYLSRLFKEKTGNGFMEALTDVRISRAKTLLEVQVLKVKEVAEMVGYRDVSHFISNFKQTTGVTPSEYRAALNK